MKETTRLAAVVVAVALSIMACADFGSGGDGSAQNQNNDATATLKVVNEGTITLYGLYMRESGTGTWYGDQMDGYRLAGGETFILSAIPLGTYDLDINYADGYYLRINNVGLTRATTYNFVIDNDGGGVSAASESSLRSTRVPTRRNDRAVR